MLDRRVTYKRKCSFRTKSNKFKKVKTPGGKLAIQYLKKKAAGVRYCEDGCEGALPGIPHMRPADFARIAKQKRTVARAYGGTKCHNCVKNRIVRAFLIEEVKLIKQMTSQKEKSSKPKKPKDKKKGKKK